MAHARYRARGRARGPKRKTQWYNGVMGTAWVDVAAGVQTDITIYVADTEDVGTLERIFGNLSLMPQSDVRAVFNMGIVKTEGHIGSTNIPDVEVAGDQDVSWLWKTMRSHSTGTVEPPGGAGATNLLFDIKAKRILRNNDSLVLSFNCDIAYSYAAFARLLIKLS